MISKLSSLFVGIALLAGLSFSVTGVLSPSLVYAAENSTGEACTALGQVSGSASDDECNPPAGRGVQSLIRLSVTILSIIAGIIAVISIMIAGLKYITSQGDAAQVSSAKRALIYAVVGMIVVGVSQVLVRFVLAKSS